MHRQTQQRYQIPCETIPRARAPKMSPFPNVVNFYISTPKKKREKNDSVLYYVGLKFFFAIRYWWRTRREILQKSVVFHDNETFSKNNNDGKPWNANERLQSHAKFLKLLRWDFVERSQEPKKLRYLQAFCRWWRNIRQWIHQRVLVFLWTESLVVVDLLNGGGGLFNNAEQKVFSSFSRTFWWRECV